MGIVSIIPSYAPVLLAIVLLRVDVLLLQAPSSPKRTQKSSLNQSAFRELLFFFGVKSRSLLRNPLHRAQHLVADLLITIAVVPATDRRSNVIQRIGRPESPVGGLFFTSSSAGAFTMSFISSFQSSKTTVTTCSPTLKLFKVFASNARMMLPDLALILVSLPSI